MSSDDGRRPPDPEALERLQQRGLTLVLIGVAVASGYVVGSVLGWLPREARYVGFVGLVLAFVGSGLRARARRLETFEDED
ncbi:MAG: hypothetical protein KDD11_20145 [Acidobacteria bacterium]|nr:hypothetical protein [Acidobacteriota bacterium]